MTLPPNEPAPQDLRERAVRGTAAAFSSQALKFAINFGVGITLARLLTPEDFGIFAIAFAVTGFLEFAKDGGLVVPVIQSESISPEQLDTLFWLNAGIGIAVTLIACAVAPIIGLAYADDRLVWVIGALALVFLFGGIATQHLALLRRQMRFAALAVCEVTALVVASAFAIYAALHGARYWSLVYFQLVREVVQTALVVTMTGWRPAWPTRMASVAPLVRFGGLMMAFDLIGYLTFKLDNLIVAWFLGPAALGFYDKGYSFLLLPVNQINAPLSGVVHSTLSRLQHDHERYRAYLSRAITISAGLGMPLTAFLFGNAHIVVAQLLGEQWLPSAAIFRALAPAAFLMTVSTCVGWIFLSLGRAERQLTWAAFSTALTIVAFLVGVRWGAVGVALAFSTIRVVLFLPTIAYTVAQSAVTISDVLVPAVRPAVASVLALVASLATNAVFPVTAWSLPRNGLAFAATYVLCWAIAPGGRAVMRDNLLALRTTYR